MIYTTSYSSPLGMLALVSDGTTITELQFGVSITSTPCCPLLDQAVQQLEEYFSGKRQQFHLPLAPHGTEFQQSVWRALCQIPYGETRSYAQLAAMVGRPSACRAVGNANGKNPLPILIPCHRVIRTDGSLGGYSFDTDNNDGFLSGLEIKQYLLRLEQQIY